MKLQYASLIIFVVLWQPALQQFLSNRFHGNFLQQLRSRNESPSAKYKYQIKTIDVPVDHFSFSIQDTFKLRYLLNNTWQKGDDAPILFYTGNEGSIETFAANTGFIWETAPELGALIIFAEHRYYGESLPYGNKSYADSHHLGYLTSEQALADYVDLIQYLRSKPENKRSPVVVIGGSYGGMLSAWMRMKYPHIVQGTKCAILRGEAVKCVSLRGRRPNVLIFVGNDGTCFFSWQTETCYFSAIAASAPILQFTGIVECEAFARIVTSDFNKSHQNCPKLIRRSWSVITNVTSTDTGKTWLSDNWKLCQPLKDAADVKQLKSYLEDIYTNLAMVDYPYEANFLAPLPAYPINAVCKQLTNGSLTGKDLLVAIHKAISVFTNYTSETKCLSLNDSTPELGATGWPYQSCTEMVMPMCPDGVNDMFEPNPWNFDDYAKDCAKQFSVKPQPNLICQRYGCTELATATNIIFSNGLLDPWTSGGVIRNLSSSAVAIIIPEGAHHLDLRGSDANDPYSVILARKYHRFYIRQWIKEYRTKPGK